MIPTKLVIEFREMPMVGGDDEFFQIVECTGRVNYGEEEMCLGRWRVDKKLMDHALCPGYLSFMLMDMAPIFEQADRLAKKGPPYSE